MFAVNQVDISFGKYWVISSGGSLGHQLLDLIYWGC